MCIDQSRLGYNRLYKNSLSLTSPCSWVCTQRGRYVLLSRQSVRCYFPCPYQRITVLQRPAHLDANWMWHCQCSWTDARLFLWSSSPCDASYHHDIGTAVNNNNKVVLGRGHTILTSRALTSRNVCDNRNVWGVLAHEITWRKQSDRSVNLRGRIQW